MTIQEVKFENIICYLCGSGDSKEWLRGRDRGFGVFSFRKCDHCGLIYISPRPTLESMGHYYADDYTCYDPSGRFMDRIKSGMILAVAEEHWGYRGKRSLLRGLISYPFRQVFCRVPQFVAGGKILDIGCAIGKDLDIYKGLGWETYGVEINAAAADVARSKGHQVFTGTLEAANFPACSFDAVTLWDVMEHVHDPVATLTSISRVLKVGGRLLIRTPNSDSFQAHYFGDRWGAGAHIPQHLFLFSPNTLSGVARKAGFATEMVATTSTPFNVKRFLDRVWFDRFGPKHPIALRIFGLLDTVIGIPAWPLVLLFGGGDLMTVHLRKDGH